MRNVLHHGVRSFVTLVCVLALPLTAGADTIAYWRFEGADETTRMQDASGNGHTLTNVGTNVYTLPGTGTGSAFPDPVGKGLSNSLARLKDVQTDVVNTPDTTDLYPGATGQFMVEMLVNVQAGADGTHQIIGQWADAPSSDRSWAIYRLRDPQTLGLKLSTTGANLTSYSSGMILELNTDYYVGVAFDLSKVGVGQNGITFYVKDLTHSGLLQIATVDLLSGTLFNSTAVLQIGARGSNSSGTNLGDRWRGVIDEVRLSNVVLPQGELLFLPEPATALLWASGLLLVGRGRRAAQR